MLRPSLFIFECSFVVFVFLGSYISPAWAALGGDNISILADQGQMQGSRKQMTVHSYSVQEIQAQSGTVVREYQGADGNVFAVAWHGPVMPDMRQILGSYYDQYAKARQQQNTIRRGRHPIAIDEPGLVVQIGGHPRWFVGKAYIPGKLPQGVQAEDIQ
ncbi:MAG TPA: DUF2844 domain-containing protein [Candidatus Aquilonibacter sp.]|nr:DUF2844 domain-containing protein [Candidatus Aquilonibacter sp.]